MSANGETPDEAEPDLDIRHAQATAYRSLVASACIAVDDAVALKRSLESLCVAVSGVGLERQGQRANDPEAVFDVTERLMRLAIGHVQQAYDMAERVIGTPPAQRVDPHARAAPSSD